MKYPEGKYIEQEIRLVAAKNREIWVEKGAGETANKYEVSFRDDKNIPKLIVMMVAQLCGHTQIQWIVHIKWANCMICKLYHYKALVFKKRKKKRVKGP